MFVVIQWHLDIRPLVIRVSSISDQPKLLDIQTTLTNNHQTDLHSYISRHEGWEKVLRLYGYPVGWLSRYHCNCVFLLFPNSTKCNTFSVRFPAAGHTGILCVLSVGEVTFLDFASHPKRSRIQTSDPEVEAEVKLQTSDFGLHS